MVQKLVKKIIASFILPDSSSICGDASELLMQYTVTSSINKVDCINKGECIRFNNILTINKQDLQKQLYTIYFLHHK